MTRTLDVRGLRCPLPVLKAGKLIRDMVAGEELLVLATDPMAELDFRHFCTENGHAFLGVDREGDPEVLAIRLRVRAQSRE